MYRAGNQSPYHLNLYWDEAFSCKWMKYQLNCYYLVFIDQELKIMNSYWLRQTLQNLYLEHIGQAWAASSATFDFTGVPVAKGMSCVTDCECHCAEVVGTRHTVSGIVILCGIVGIANSWPRRFWKGFERLFFYFSIKLFLLCVSNRSVQTKIQMQPLTKYK